jgi:hypothetical protein
VATNAGTQELTATTIDEQPPASFRATYDPVRDLIAWSDDDEVCFV